MSDIEFFELKYLEEINELFVDMKEITRFNNLSLFHEKRDTCMDLFDFIFHSIQIPIEEENDEDTFNDEENYSMLK